MEPAAAPIRLAEPADVAAMVAIERAAGAPFRAAGMDLVADDEPDAEALAKAVRDRRAFVATVDDVPAGYLMVALVDGAAHVEQVSVHPDWGRRGIGRALMVRAEAWAREEGVARITLTTFVEVPWNGPWYARLGYRAMAPEEETPELRAIRARERAAGMEAWPRTAMVRAVGGPESGGS